MKLKKRHYKMALCAGRMRCSDPFPMSKEREIAWIRAVDSVWFWSLKAARLAGYR